MVRRPGLKRWASPDTVVPIASQGVQSLDRYAYVNNSHLMWGDPTGNSVDCAVGDNWCRAGKLPPSSLIGLYGSFYDLGNKVNPDTVWAWKSLMYDLDNYLRQYYPKFSPSDERLDGLAKFYYDNLRMDYWIIRANGDLEEAFNLRAYYDYNLRFSEAHWDGSKVNWWITGPDLVGLAASLFALGAPAKSFARALAVWISRGTGLVSAGLSADEGDYGSVLVTTGGFTPPPFGPTFSFVAVMQGLSKGYYFSPYVPSVLDE